MTAPAATQSDFRTALAHLAAVAAGVACRRADDRARRRLQRAVEEATELLRTRTDGVPVMAVGDADALIEAYIAAGGDWPRLAAAVNRHGLRGTCRKAS